MSNHKTKPTLLIGASFEAGASCCWSGQRTSADRSLRCGKNPRSRAFFEDSKMEQQTTAQNESDRLIRIADVMHVVGLRKTAVYQLIKVGSFPAPVKVGAASLWSERAVQSWVAQQLATAAA